MFYAILTVVLVAVDQLVKYLVVEHIPMGTHTPFIPYLLDLTYVQNTGAAFSFMSEHTWILTIISVVMSLVLIWAVAAKFFSHPLGRLALTLILAGAIGNLIDRILLGYVVDMFNVLFMNFAVFNVADICVVVGGFGSAIYYSFFYDKIEKDTTDDKTDTDC